MAKLNLYPAFKLWEKFDNIYIISDTHFGDIVTDEKGKDDYREANTGIKAPSIEEQVALINKVCHKNDLLIILGDVGKNIEPVKKLKAGYKVLIMGNHDSGRTNYERKVTHKKYLGGDTCPCCGEIVTYDGLNSYSEFDKVAWCRKCLKKVNPIKNYDGQDTDNKLFDEVYPGKVTIKENITLSHEPVDDKYSLNIHGHDHSCSLMKSILLEKPDLKPEEYLNAQIEKVKELNLKKLNVCSEWINYVPLNLKKLMESGILKEIPDIHREAIDKQIENPIHSTLLN